MSWSSVKRLTNDMNALEQESNRYIQPDSYYIVRMHLENISEATLSREIEKKSNDFAEEMLYSDPQPIAVYSSTDEIILIFSCMMDGEKHQFGGDHHKIVSKYTFGVARAIPSIQNIDTKIVEFDTQTQVITYLSWVVFQSSQRMMQRLSNGKITDNLLYFRTEKELREILAKEGIEWNSLDPSERYGVFTKLRRKRDKITTAKLSEQFDARENKRYANFIFG